MTPVAFNSQLCPYLPPFAPSSLLCGARATAPTPPASARRLCSVRHAPPQPHQLAVARSGARLRFASCAFGAVSRSRAVVAGAWRAGEAPSHVSARRIGANNPPLCTVCRRCLPWARVAFLRRPYALAYVSPPAQVQRGAGLTELRRCGMVRARACLLPLARILKALRVLTRLSARRVSPGAAGRGRQRARRRLA